MTSRHGAAHAVRAFTFTDIDDRISAPRRLERLRDTGLMSARALPALDGITHLAAEMTGAHQATISMVETDRQAFPSSYAPNGFADVPTEIPLTHSFCQYIVMNNAPLVFSDARTHPVLHQHPAVLDHGLIAFAGFPVHAPEGEVLGALFVADVVPRSWTATHLTALAELADAVNTKIALRLSRRELHLDHERLMHVLDGATRTMIIIADLGGVIRTMNRVAVEALEPATGARGSKAIPHPDGSGRAWNPADHLGGAQDWTLSPMLGEPHVFSVRVRALHDPEGQVNGYVIIGDDVTAQRRAEDLLRDAVRRQTEAVARLELLGSHHRSFIAAANHELRTPLTSILGYTELLTEVANGDLSETQRSMVSGVHRNAQRLQDLVEDLLSTDRFTHKPADVLRAEVDVQALVEQTWQQTQIHLAGRDLRISADVSTDVTSVSGDAHQLGRALLHVLTNAIRFTPDGGAVRLTVRNAGDDIAFDVSDTGIGIREEYHSSVFEPFFRTDPAHVNAVQGAGIGLAVVRGVVASHGGDIRLTSTVGRGTTVRLTIPAHTPEHSG